MHQRPFDRQSSAPFDPEPQDAPQRSPVRLVTILVIVLVVLVGLGAGGYFLLQKSNTPTTNVAPTPTLVNGLYQASLTSNPGNWTCPSKACAFQDDGYHIKNAQKDSLAESLLLKQTFGD